MLQAGKLLRENGDENDENSPFEDYSIYMYRQSAPEFKDRVKDLEQKLLFPVRKSVQNVFCVVFQLSQKKNLIPPQRKPNIKVRENISRKK